MSDDQVLAVTTAELEVVLAVASVALLERLVLTLAG
jgi:hypothetical protein